MRRVIKLLAAMLALLAGLLARPAFADSWAPAQVQTIASADGRARFTITPRSIDSSLAYFEDRVAGRQPAGQRSGAGSRQAMGRLQVRDGGRWRTRWEGPLVNDVSPVSALVANGGTYVVTFDNWHSYGWGDNVVVIYRADGTAVRAFRLDEIVPSYMIDSFSRSVSSLYWQAEGTQIERGRLRLAIVEPGSDFPGNPRGFFVDIDLATGAVSPIADADLARWRPRACEIHRRAIAGLQAWIERERGGLVAPASQDPQALETYGYQVARRLYMPEQGESRNIIDPGTPIVVRLPEAQEFMAEDSLSSFREFLTLPASEASRRLFLAIRQDQLVAEVERAAAGLAAGRLAGVEMIFVADAAHWARIDAALRTSGATLRQIVPTVPLPQHPRNLQDMPAPRAIDPACAG